jgi:hypothetical protein
MQRFFRLDNEIYGNVKNELKQNIVTAGARIIRKNVVVEKF